MLQAGAEAPKSQNSSDRDSRSVDYKAARKKLRHTIRRSKILCWRKLVEDANRDPWELGYKIVTKKLGAHTLGTVMEVASVETIVGTLFPTHPTREDRPIEDVGEFPYSMKRN